MRSLISIDFPAAEMEPEAVSIPSSNVAICDAATPRHSPILRYTTPLLRAMF